MQPEGLEQGRGVGVRHCQQLWVNQQAVRRERHQDAQVRQPLLEGSDEDACGLLARPAVGDPKQERAQQLQAEEVFHGQQVQQGGGQRRQGPAQAAPRVASAATMAQSENPHRARARKCWLYATDTACCLKPG